MTLPHHLTLRVYYEDTDFSGLVYHAAYLHFFERGRTEMLRELGIHHSELHKAGIAFAVRKMGIDFLAPARIDDVLEVTTEVVFTTAARLNLSQQAFRSGALIATAEVQVVAIKTGGGVARLPKRLLELGGGVGTGRWSLPRQQ